MNFIKKIYYKVKYPNFKYLEPRYVSDPTLLVKNGKFYVQLKNLHGEKIFRQDWIKDRYALIPCLKDVTPKATPKNYQAPKSDSTLKMAYDQLNTSARVPEWEVPRDGLAPVILDLLDKE